VAGRALDQGDGPLALRAATLAADIEPLHEPVRSVIIRAHLLEGDHVGAVRHYRQFEKLLDDELRILPSPRLRALVQPYVRPTRRAVGRRATDGPSQR
jgi:DNA-binding SARP family transcriptional activator